MTEGHNPKVISDKFKLEVPGGIIIETGGDGIGTKGRDHPV
jgi:hypothetical protein